MSEAPDTRAAEVGRLVTVLYVSAVVTAVVAAVLALVVSPALLALIALAVADVIFAKLFESGRIGPLAGARRNTGPSSADPGSLVEGDPSVDPYARED